ncbi:MAG: glycosyltransferase family 2 protein [Anaerolineae bacterium]|nr:glycosyltransferase family 2 protein [Anaerolineae bacterium]
MSEKPDLSIVIPLYNSAANLTQLLDRLDVVLPGVADEYEVILVNDGSRDDTWAHVQAEVPHRAHVVAFNLMRNYGQHNALLCGIRAARHDITVTMDDDLQHPPEEIPRLVEKLHEGYDVVYGTPQKQQHGLWRNLASRLIKLALQSAMGTATARDVSAFRAFRTELRESFDTYRSPFVSIDVLLTWGTTRFAALPVRHEPRQVGASNYTFGKLVSHALDMLTGFTNLPLRLASWIGFGFTLFGLGVLAYVLGRYVIEGGSVPGFPFLASIIAIFSGAQLFALGIIGEYLARIHVRSMGRPDYAVRDVCTSVDADDLQKRLEAVGASEKSRL